MAIGSCCGGGALSYVASCPSHLPSPPLYGKKAAASQVATPGQRLADRLSHAQSARFNTTVSHRPTSSSGTTAFLKPWAVGPVPSSPLLSHAGRCTTKMISYLLDGPQYNRGGPSLMYCHAVPCHTADVRRLFFFSVGLLPPFQL